MRLFSYGVARMIRAALTGFAATLTICFQSFAAPPPPPPELPADTPESVMGYDTAELYRSFIRWTQREADKAVASRQELDEMSIRMSMLPRALRFHVDGDWPYTDVAGGIEMACDPEEDEAGPGLGTSIFGTAGMSEDEIARRCYWQMRIIDVPGAEALARSWMGETFNPLAAAAHLSRIGVRPGSDLMASDVDWSGYQPIEEMRQPPILRVRRYTDRTCGAFVDALAAIEALELGRIDIEDFGHTNEVEGTIAHMPWLATTVFSINAGAEAEITFKGKAGAPSLLLDEVDRIIWSCSPVQ